jgi:NAD(P)-dependent dehydrogenase (short-subunit alcohol dehydrogenase family)
VESEISERRGRALYVRCDVTDEEQCAASVAAAVEQFGTLTGVVANASGYASWTSQGASGKWLTELTLDAWNETITTDLTGAFLTLKHAVRAMCEHDGGSVVTISSHTAMEGVNGNDAYAAAKGGVISLTRGVASYYARYDIRANSLAVGFVDSGPSVAGLRQQPAVRQMLYQHSLGRPGRPSDIGYACVYLLADESEYLSGAIILIDGGSYGASHMHSPREGDLPHYTRKRPVEPVFPTELGDASQP